MARACENRTSESDLQSEAPPTIAMSTCPSCSARAPSNMACSDDAQAELMARNGPVRPKALLIVPATRLADTSGESAAQRQSGADPLDQFADDLVLLVRRQALEIGDLAQELERLLHARGIGVIAAQSAALGMSDVDARVAQRQVERIEPGVTKGRPATSHIKTCTMSTEPAELFGNRTRLAIEAAAGDDRAQLRIRLAANAHPRIIIQCLVEPIRRQFANRAATFDQQPPVFLQIVGPWQSAGHANDCQRNPRRSSHVSHLCSPPLADRVCVIPLVAGLCGHARRVRTKCNTPPKRLAVFPLPICALCATGFASATRRCGVAASTCFASSTRNLEMDKPLGHGHQLLQDAHERFRVLPTPLHQHTSRTDRLLNR